MQSFAGEWQWKVDTFGLERAAASREGCSGTKIQLDTPSGVSESWISSPKGRPNLPLVRCLLLQRKLRLHPELWSLMPMLVQRLRAPQVLRTFIVVVYATMSIARFKGGSASACFASVVSRLRASQQELRNSKFRKSPISTGQKVPT